MRQTVLGVFDRSAAARAAAQQLRDSGFGDSVQVTDELDSVGAAAPDEHGVMAHVRSFFAELFGPGDERQVPPYAEAVRRGGAVVKVTVDGETEADAARTALQAAGAVDLEERVTEWRAAGWSDEPYFDASATAGASNRTAGWSRPATATAAGAADTMRGRAEELGGGAAPEATFGAPGAEVRLDRGATLAGDAPRRADTPEEPGGAAGAGVPGPDGGAPRGL